MQDVKYLYFARDKIAQSLFQLLSKANLYFMNVSLQWNNCFITVKQLFHLSEIFVSTG